MIGIVIAVVAIIIVAAAAVMLMNNNGNNDNNKPDDKPSDDYYPITVDVKVGDTTYKQTFKERPSRIVTVWDQSAELMCYFGLEKSVVKAYAGSDYITVNPGLQNTFNALDKNDPSTELSIENGRRLSETNTSARSTRGTREALTASYATGLPPASKTTPTCSPL